MVALDENKKPRRWPLYLFAVVVTTVLAIFLFLSTSETPLVNIDKAVFQPSTPSPPPEEVPVVQASKLSPEERLRSSVIARELAHKFADIAVEPHPVEVTVPRLHRLADCLGTNTCGPGEETVVLLASWHFGAALLGWTSGEDIWAKSSMKSFEHYNYTMLYASNVHDIYYLYSHLPHLIKVIMWEGDQYHRCLDGFRTPDWSDEVLPTGCMATTWHPEGIPIWKSFVFHFWQENMSPLGRDWTLSPEDYKDMYLENGGPNQYLGYSIEERCHKIPIPEVREHRGILLGKRLSYFSAPDMMFDGIGSIIPDVPPHADSTMGTRKISNFSLVSTAHLDEGDVFPQEGVEVVTDLQQFGWTQEVAGSKVMIGVGWPKISPSPWDALCLGVPFINPIREWDPHRPNDRTKWLTQNNAMLKLDPPYVYHVFRDDIEGLRDAVIHAVSNPIESFVPPDRRMPAVRMRHRKFVETDWFPLAKEYAAREYPNGDFPYLLAQDA